ncbi:hypothetical protein AB0C51_17860 [Streptomyces pathocidini]|uniref:hypothetical protein n=1 Tax=Streptomyces pathocidini TaxID=1650571 RepID=UPI0033DA85A4
MAGSRGSTVQDRDALAEIELCGELMIAASGADGEWLSHDRIDEVLRVRGATVAGTAKASERVEGADEALGRGGVDEALNQEGADGTPGWERADEAPGPN